MYVVERLIDKICEFDYPKDKFEIQIIDDSTDETVAISQKKVDEYSAKGFDIKMVQRDDRVGYKAGALKHANNFAKGDFLAIFDADFLPRKDFLKTTIPVFEDEKVGVVQTRWEHINQNYSIITKLQALQLNVHFTVEQTGRKAGNYLLQFNGTAGVWRKQCIDDAGGWEADTLTEDLDLSYRAQMKGWEIKYLEKFGSPAELPAEMNGLKSQQFRWMKGGASGVFLFILLAGLVSVPLVFLLETIVVDVKYFAVFLISMFSVIAVYYVANVEAELNRKSYIKTLLKFVLLFPVFLSLSMGLSLHNTIAVLQGYRGKKSPFIRTPKFNITTIKDSFQKTNYLPKKLPWTTIFEGILACYFVGGVVAGMYLQNTTFVFFHALLAAGFGTICFYSVRHYSFK